MGEGTAQGKNGYLTESGLRELININPLKAIDEKVAERQFQVILKGFNHLYNHGNFLYVADEVGLGKTYIALGIASLLRHFSGKPEKYQDLIMVPRKNLQYKWQKDLNNFIRNNYIREDNLVKTVTGQTVGRQKLYHKLEITPGDTPAYFLYRHSSFSLASSDEDESWKEKLKAHLPEEKQLLFDKICRKLRKEDDIYIKRAYGYILNTLFPPTEMVIVDEAHYYKHGVGEDVSIRNQIVSRMFRGYTDKYDLEMLDHFPELKEQISPKVDRLIFLSATPMDKSLIEIKRQMDCFLEDANHPFAHLNNLDQEDAEKEINRCIHQFMIRGVMNFRLNNREFSRNQYRFEHRFGNVRKTNYDSFQTLTDNKQALIMGLVQYKTIRELKNKNNNSFEMGLLAGFESFGKKSEFDTETSSSRREREAKDQDVIENLVNSYRKAFNEYPPHPKQDNLAEVLLESMINQEKSLVFVRRIASVMELEKKLSDRYSQYLIDKIKRIKGTKRNRELDMLLKSYRERNLREDIEHVFDMLAERLISELEKEERLELINWHRPDEEYTLRTSIRADLKELYDSNGEELPDHLMRQHRNYQEELREHGKRQRSRMNAFLKETARELLLNISRKNIVLGDEEEEGIPTEEQANEEKSPYFFHRYFLQEGKKFKTQSYKKDWYEINYLLIGEAFDLFDIDYEQLLKEPVSTAQKPTEVSLFRIAKDNMENAIRSGRKKPAEPDPFYRKETFLTHLLLNEDLCREEFKKWLENRRHYLDAGHYTRFFDELENLAEMPRGIFRNGSGLVPAYVAYSLNDFKKELVNLLQSEFSFVLREVCQIIRDYDRILDNNFSDRSRIRYTLFQQLPVSGVSGEHKKDVSKAAAQFRMPGYPYVLISTDMLKDGEDLHLYCKNVYHYGIAWNPSDMEQRNGRIDRIDSLTYRQIKQDERQIEQDIPFERKMQVFYPYLRDTLEVNQMVVLFKGMDHFINIFYREISGNLELSPQSSTDAIVDGIPPQKNERLESTYDHDAFHITEKEAQPVLQPRPLTGTNREKLVEIMEAIYEGMTSNGYTYYVPPELDRGTLYLYGVLRIPDNERRGSFRIWFNHDIMELGKFRLKAESCFGRISRLKKSLFREIAQKLEQKGISITRKNQYFWLQRPLSVYSREPKEILDELIGLIKYTDQLEEEYYEEDEEVM
ncbi:MAG: helicase-related protein [Bacteroidales bacterium]